MGVVSRSKPCSSICLASASANGGIAVCGFCAVGPILLAINISATCLADRITDWPFVSTLNILFPTD